MVFDTMTTSKQVHVSFESMTYQDMTHLLKETDGKKYKSTNGHLGYTIIGGSYKAHYILNTTRSR